MSRNGFLATIGRAMMFALAAHLAGWTSCSRGAPPEIAPDLILHSGKIATLNDDFSVAEALAVRDGKIVATGNDREVLELGGTETELRDLAGRTVIPGFNDTHNHPTSQGMRIFRVDLNDVRSIDEIVERIEADVATKEPGEWVTNSGYWNEPDLEEKRNPTRYDLDPVSPDNPVFLGRGHMAVVNTLALKVAGITESTPDPPGGSFERDDETGELTGRLYETAIARVRSHVPPPTREQTMAAQREAFRDLAAAGVTSVRPAAASAEAMRGFIALHHRDELPIRTSVMLHLDPNAPPDELEELLREAPVASGLGDHKLSFWGVKMTADGGSDLAYLRKEYVSQPGFHGQQGGSLEAFSRAVMLCNRYGWRVGIHAVGDAAIDLVLDAYEAADAESPIFGKRWTIEHGYFLHDEHYDRIERLGLILLPQTRHLTHLRESFLTHYGAEYADMTHPYRTIIERGIPMAGGADWRVAPSDFFYYMWAAMTRTTVEGAVVAPRQALSREEALRLHTQWGAYVTFEEEVKGSLVPGQFADLVVLSDDFLTVPEEEIKDIRPVLTMVGGTVIFEED